MIWLAVTTQIAKYVMLHCDHALLETIMLEKGPKNRPWSAIQL